MQHSTTASTHGTTFSTINGTASLAGRLGWSVVAPFDRRDHIQQAPPRSSHDPSRPHRAVLMWDNAECAQIATRPLVPDELEHRLAAAAIAPKTYSPVAHY